MGDYSGLKLVEKSIKTIKKVPNSKAKAVQRLEFQIFGADLSASSSLTFTVSTQLLATVIFEDL